MGEQGKRYLKRGKHEVKEKPDAWEIPSNPHG